MNCIAPEGAFKRVLFMTPPPNSRLHCNYGLELKHGVDGAQEELTSLRHLSLIVLVIACIWSERGTSLAQTGI